jgi:hypothetical protein
MRFAPISLDKADWPQQLEGPPFVFARGDGAASLVTALVCGDFAMMRDETVIEEKRLRVEIEKMDTAFCRAMLSAIDAGTEHSPEGICKEPGTRRPIVFWPISSSVSAL